MRPKLITWGQMEDIRSGKRWGLSDRVVEVTSVASAQLGFFFGFFVAFSLQRMQ